MDSIHSSLLFVRTMETLCLATISASSTVPSRMVTSVIE